MQWGGYMKMRANGKKWTPTMKMVVGMIQWERPAIFSRLATTIITTHCVAWMMLKIRRVLFLWRSEFRNILAGYLRRGSLTYVQACAVRREAEALLDGAEHEPDSKRVLELVRTSDCSAYDCEFVAVAEETGTNLVTMDAKLLKAFPKIAKSLIAG
jgi:predicted nucleic acid-binding protein